MSAWQTALMSLAGLAIGASVAVVGAFNKSPELVNLGCTICGGALGMFVPQTRNPSQTPPKRILPPA